MTAPIAKKNILLLTNTENKETFEIVYRPSTVTISQSASMRTSGVIALQRELQVTELADRKFTLNKLRLEGKAEVGKIEMLLKWLQPEKTTSEGAQEPEPESKPPAGSHKPPEGEDGEGGKGKGGKEAGKPAVLTLHLGSTVEIVALREVSATYLRFNSDGDPIRAELTLLLVQVPPKKGSPDAAAGAGGDRTHQLTEGENLAQVAHANTGNPDYRAMADANHIDDPNRVNSGTQLRVPA